MAPLDCNTPPLAHKIPSPLTWFSTRQSAEGGRVVEAMRQQRQEDYSVLGLLLNIEKMEEYLRVKGLMDHLATFRYG